ncbi:MAG: hypothetical protein J6D03_01375 [Clostridia bacterium]|nr:hypothetical protein [Clostridia bacterium]
MELFNEITNSFYFTAIIRILIGILLAGIIGLEREVSRVIQNGKDD